MPTGGLLNISAAYDEKNGAIEIRFSDTGRGMPEKVLQTLSRPSEDKSIEDIERTGISLAVCRDIIALHKGAIYAAPQSGAGTSITIKLPV